jgi:pyruvate ferredoxin oxidoreductase alpha subunit
MEDVRVVEGSEAVALAVKACRPHVIAAYPISPQTHIVETLARMVADGDLNAEYVRVESEFSAASVVSGAPRQAAAARRRRLPRALDDRCSSARMRLPFVIWGQPVISPDQYQVDHQDTISLGIRGYPVYVESIKGL